MLPSGIDYNGHGYQASWRTPGGLKKSRRTKSLSKALQARDQGILAAYGQATLDSIKERDPPLPEEPPPKPHYEPVVPLVLKPFLGFPAEYAHVWVPSPPDPCVPA